MINRILLAFYRRLFKLFSANVAKYTKTTDDQVLSVSLKNYSSYQNEYGISYDIINKNVLHKALNINDQDLVLDVGGGHDPLVRANVIVDIDTEETSHRNFNKIKLYPHQKFVCSNIEDLSCFQDNEFDYVFCSQVLEHVSDPERACSELQRVAKRGFIDTPRSGFDLAVGHPDHKWLIDYIDGILYFRPKMVIGIGSVLFADHAFSAWQSDKLVQDRISSKYRNLSNNCFEWDGGFKYKVLKKW